MRQKTNTDASGSESNEKAVWLSEAIEFLRELKTATEEAAPCELHDFATMLLQVFELHEQSADDSETNAFLDASLQEIRDVVTAEEVTSERLESLRDEAFQRWGELLMPMDDTAFENAVGEHDQWDEPEAAADPETDDFVAPSAEEINSLMSQLNGLAESSEPETTNAVSSPAVSSPEVSAPEIPSARPAAPLIENSRSESIESLDPELREAFMDDAASCLCSMEDALLRLESDAHDSDSLNQICRELHTLKGASASVGLTALADQLHQLEDELREDHDAKRAPNINELLKNVDSIRVQLGGEEAEGDGSSDLAAASVQPAAPNVSPSPSPSFTAVSDGPDDDESVRVKSSQLNRLMDMLAELVMLRNRRETELNELQENYHELIGSVSKMRLISNDDWREQEASASLQLSEVANDVLEVAQRVRDCARPVAEGNTAVSQFIRQFRQELVELRRTPVSGLFRRLQRVVRDAAQAESKQVQLRLIGEHAGIERSLQQRLYEPLLHIVRNSVCHGIESPEDRVNGGKDAVGTITLEAVSGPDLFVIEIRDDGRGLDYDAIRRRGVASGLLAADHAASREELSQLIFHPGFSTRQTANQVAGRGVGMDVVASTLKRMRGWLQVDSEPGQGTRVRLSFPLPSVIQHAMVFRSSEQMFAIPMQSVRSAGDARSTSQSLSFSQLLGNAKCEPSETCQRIELACSVSGGDSSESASGVTLVVDEIVGPEEVVVRPLPSMLKHHPFCVGATLSGMGQTVLFLDARRLVEANRQHLRSSNEQSAPRHDAITPPQSSLPRVLVVDDSLSARKRVVRSLQRYDVEIVEASDGRQGLELAKAQKFDAVFSDMEMPHVSGMELLAEINSETSLHRPPVVIISSRCEEEYTSRACELGANNYLIKPLADDALDEALVGIPALQHLPTNSPSQLHLSGEIQ